MAQFDMKLLVTAALAMMVAAIVLSVGVEINQTLEEDSANSTTFSRYNDTFTASNTSAAALSSPLMTSGTLTVYLSNASGTFISLGNFTIDYTLSTLQLKTPDVTAYNASGMNANYDYLAHGLAWNTTRNSTKGMVEYASWFTTIALVVAAAVLLLLLGANFNTRRRL